MQTVLGAFIDFIAREISAHCQYFPLVKIEHNEFAADNSHLSIIQALGSSPDRSMARGRTGNWSSTQTKQVLRCRRFLRCLLDAQVISGSKSISFIVARWSLDKLVCRLRRQHGSLRLGATCNASR